jgi:uncharacterized protein (DUF1499 family)
LRAARGMTLSLILLMPFAYFSVLGFSLPRIYDVSTDLDDPPDYTVVLKQRSEVMNTIAKPGEVQKSLQLLAYPGVGGRRYPLDAGKVFEEVIALLRGRGWTVLAVETTSGFASIDQEESALANGQVAESDRLPSRVASPSFRPPQFAPLDDSDQPLASVAISPIGRGVDGAAETQEKRQVEAVVKSFLFGFNSDIVIRVMESEDGTLVDMRATSRWGAHDLGSNAERIISFMNDLDAALQGLSR